MSIITNSLLAKDIRLQLKATDHRDALEEILSSFRSDSRVRDWEKLRSALIESSSNGSFKENPCSMVLHHARTEHVSGLVLAVGRSKEGFSIEGHQKKIHLLFVVAIPTALNNEYLRILGAISRVCRDPFTYGELLATTDPAGFLAILEKGCRQ